MCSSSGCRSVTEQVAGAAGGGVYVRVAGEFKPVPELPAVTTRESDKPAVSHLPEYQVRITDITFTKVHITQDLYLISLTQVSLFTFIMKSITGWPDIK